jgi:predicted lipid-binding transport protein (Tim44 family)
MTTSFIQRSITASLVVLASVGLLIASDAEAKRVGSGGSSGRQSSNVSNRTQAPTETKAPTAGSPAAAPAAGAAAGAAGKAAPAAAAQSTRSKWLGPLAGLAAGLGLAALASSLGFGEGFGQIMMVLLMVMVAFFLFRFIMARRAAGNGAGAGPTPAYSAPGTSYTPQAEPEQSAPAQARTGSMIGSGIGAGVATSAQAQEMTAIDPSWRIPADMDVEGFLSNAKSQFTRLQAAYDRADLNELHEYTTQEMYKEVAQEIVARAGKTNQTDIVRLEAGLLGVESNAREHLASVRFTGQLREDGAVAENLDEVWNFSKPAQGAGGWVLAGIQQY